MHHHIILKELKKRREILGITQEHLSELSGVGLRTLKLLETGKGNPTLVTLTKLTKVLGMELNLQVKQPNL